MGTGPPPSKPQRGPRTNTGGALVVPKRTRPSRPCNRGRDDPTAKKPALSVRRGALMTQTRRRPPSGSGGASEAAKRSRPPRPCDGCLNLPNATQTSAPTAQAPHWCQSEAIPRTHATGFPPSKREGGPHAHTPVASVVPKQRRLPCPCGGGLIGPKAKGANTPTRQGLGGPKGKEAPGPERPEAR